MTDSGQLAKDLAAATANFDQLVERRAAEQAQGLLEAAARRIADAEATAASWERRFTGLQAELARQRPGQERQEAAADRSRKTVLRLERLYAEATKDDRGHTVLIQDVLEMLTGEPFTPTEGAR